MNVDTLEDALKLIKSCSIRNIEFKGVPPIDWDLWHDRVNTFQKSSPAKDNLSILRYALDELNDGHSGIPDKENLRTLEQASSMPFGTMIGKMAYIRLPSYNITPDYHQTDLAEDPYVKATQNILKNFDRTDISGWIVDLRINTGGNYGPMFEGIGSLLGNGVHAYLLYPQFKRENACSVNTPYLLKQAEKPIAILTGSNTSSSGELVLIAFQKLNNVRSLGESSAGNSSSNITFTFKNRPIAVTSGLMADRNKIPYGDKIHPDMPFTGGARPEAIKSENYNPAIDPLIICASKWIYQTARHHPSFPAPNHSPF